MSQKPSDTPKVCWMQHSRARNYVAEATALGARVSQARLFFMQVEKNRLDKRIICVIVLIEQNKQVKACPHSIRGKGKFEKN